ncbi:RidA family protein [Geopsychrobacter electrodiphilus]|uniref:RidA family protein n=1 Tax=Geopsychrobacter electrodiphilus TaxID=225196 RepID=UPI00037FF0E1|nr:RidA family protein [Geopsychrobacter electrodiphilus]
MEITQVITDQAPAAIGPYSQAIRAGNLLFCSGQIPLLPDGSVVEGGIREQTLQVMKNLRALVDAAGADLSRVVKTTIYLADLGDFAVVNEIYAESFTAHPPARATVQVAGLPKGVRIEIDAIAMFA